ncbi:hypothetical protein LTR84_004460 [Exophiala bonariae]|uniref:Uncharacterized protein n=1 Tax=Exophiala bonariae TaxID=1690606 RepID=A0AAV9N4T5_9EURO|nr:hypothetical protein LTR84_004460 [Exophiala bonariae]
MTFKAPSFVPPLPDVPDTVPLPEFMFDEQYGRYPVSKSRDAYTCGLTGASISSQEQKARVTYLARALAEELGWSVNEGSEFDKVAGIFALNTIDIMTLNWAILSINGVSSPANAAYSVEELRHQLHFSGCKALFTVASLLPVALEAATLAGLSHERIYICEMPGDGVYPGHHKTISELIDRGKDLPSLEPIRWTKGQGARQTAFLCYSSGTSGLPKAVMISHRNVIANTIQSCTFEKASRDSRGLDYRDVALGLLPQSHIYGLVIIAHASTWRGDQVIILPKFELKPYLSAIAKYGINTLYLVPPIAINMANSSDVMRSYDLGSVRQIYSGAAPLAKEVTDKLLTQHPNWVIRQAYGLTESSTVVSSTSPYDIWPGSSGCLLPGCEVKLIDTESEKEVTGYGEAGEILVKSPAVVLGYLKNEKATQDAFVDLPEGRFLKTGDKGEFRLSPDGKVEHLWIVDRIKELIKVMGHQVAPAELEACLLNHSAVADCAVTSIFDNMAGEVPKAYVVKSCNALVSPKSDEALRDDILDHIRRQKARYKWITGGIEFLDVIPKSPSGKILRRVLRDKEQERRRAVGAKL